MFSLLCQIKYAGSDTDFSASPAACKQIRRAEPEEQKVVGAQMPLHELLEGLIADKELPAKDKRKRMKQVWLYCWERKVISWGRGGGSVLKSWLCVCYHTFMFHTRLFSSRDPTLTCTADDFPQRRAKLPSYQRKLHVSSLLCPYSASRNPSSPSRGAGVSGRNWPELCEDPSAAAPLLALLVALLKQKQRNNHVRTLSVINNTSC